MERRLSLAPLEVTRSGGSEDAAEQQGIWEDKKNKK